MAAGRKSVSLRREFCKYGSTKGFDHHTNGSFGVEVGGSRNHHFACSGETRFHVEKEEGEICVEHELAPVVPPPEKRRKFSPIIWDLAEKEERVSSKSGILQIAALSPPCPFLSSSPGANGVDCGDVMEEPLTDSGSYPHDLEEDKDVQGWTITKSRWACDVRPSPRGADDEQKHGKVSSSPEIGEFHGGGTSESTITRSSGSSGRDHYLGASSDDTDSEKDFLMDSMVNVEEQSDDDYSLSDSDECGGSSESTITRSSGSNGRDHYSGASSDDTDSEKDFLLDSMVDVEEQSDDDYSLSDSDETGGLMHGQRNINMLQSCRSVCEFEMIKKINEGTYGVVYKARDKKTGELVALKKVKMNIERDGFPMSSLREINILLSFNHPSIVNVKEVVVDDFDGTFMVMEHMEYDLKGLMEVKKHPFSMSEIKSLVRQLLEGVKYLHDNWVIHRDLKSSNILLNHDGELKICDFGLSRQYGSPLKPYTPVVVTLWYRAPELLLGAKEYSTAIDMWSVGCIMAELIAKEPLFRGKSELEQLDKIFRTLGTPDEKIWPGLSKLPGAKANFVKQLFNTLRKKFPAASFIGLPVLSELGFDLLQQLLTYDPEKRITAEDALLHDWFHEAPLPKSDFKPIFPSWQ